jgi:hypothetical protein
VSGASHSSWKTKLEFKMKTLLTAGILAISLSGAAHAQNMFAFMEAPVNKNSSVIVIEPLSAGADGFIAIYDHHRGEVGDLLGVASVREGANRETRVRLGHPVRQDVIAFLFAGSDFTDPSTAVDSIEIDVDD